LFFPLFQIGELIILVDPRQEGLPLHYSNHWRTPILSKLKESQDPMLGCIKVKRTNLPKRLQTIRTRIGFRFHSGLRITPSKSWEKIPMRNNSLRLRMRCMSLIGTFCAIGKASRYLIILKLNKVFEIISLNFKPWSSISDCLEDSKPESHIEHLQILILWLKGCDYCTWEKPQRMCWYCERANWVEMSGNHFNTEYRSKVKLGSCTDEQLSPFIRP